MRKDLNCGKSLIINIIVLFSLALVLTSCFEVKDKTTEVETSEPINTEVNRLTEEEYLKRVKEQKGDDYYGCKKDDMWQWNLLMFEIENESFSKGMTVALFDKDSNIVNQVFIKNKYLDGSFLIKFNDTLFEKNSENELIQFLDNNSDYFKRFRKKSGK